MLFPATCISLLQLCSRRKRYLCEMWREAVVWSGLYGQSNAPGTALLTELDCLLNIAGGVAREGVMQVSHEVVPVVQRQRHEGTTHQNELHLKQEQPCDYIRTAACALSCCEQSCHRHGWPAACAFKQQCATHFTADNSRSLGLHAALPLPTSCECL